MTTLQQAIKLNPDWYDARWLPHFGKTLLSDQQLAVFRRAKAMDKMNQLHGTLCPQPRGCWSFITDDVCIYKLRYTFPPGMISGIYHNDPRIALNIINVVEPAFDMKSTLAKHTYDDMRKWIDRIDNGRQQLSFYYYINSTRRENLIQSREIQGVTWSDINDFGDATTRRKFKLAEAVYDQSNMMEVEVSEM